MNGILNILKPPGMTSFDVVSYLRGVLKIRKIGHTGTLDPGASGVLPICIGNATRAIEYLTEKDKVYRAELTLGVSTDTQDSSGTVVRESDVKVSVNDIILAVKSFQGKISQIPPMYSAVKIGGVKLYELARKGKTVERAPRQIEIYSIDILDIDGCRILFDVSCSKGTYIRTLCADIGDVLGCGGHMSFLLRTRSGPFELKDSFLLQDISELARSDTLSEKLQSVERVFENMAYLTLDEQDMRKMLNGVRLNAEGMNFPIGTVLRLYSREDGFFALGEIAVYNQKKVLKAVKLFLQ